MNFINNAVRYCNNISQFCALVISIGVVIYPILYENSNINNDFEKDNKIKLKDNIEDLFLLFSMVLSFLLFVILLKKYFPYVLSSNTIFLLINLSVHGKSAIDSMPYITAIVTKKESHFLTDKERKSLISITTAFILVFFNFDFKAVINYFYKVNNDFIPDLINFIFITFVTSVYICLSIFYLVITFGAILRLFYYLTKLKNINLSLRINKGLDNFLYYFYRKSVLNKLVEIISDIKKYNLIYIVLSMVLLLILFPVSFAWFFIYFNLSIIFGIIKMILALLHLINNLLQTLENRIKNISEKYLFNISARISIIISLLSLVIYNSCFPVFYNYNNVTNIIEFVSSTLIIPIIILLVVDYRNSTTNQRN